MRIPRLKLGATGRFPYGKVDEPDEGELVIAVAADPAQGIVRIAFGKPVAWVSMPSAQARLLAQMLIEKAAECDARKA